MLVHLPQEQDLIKRRLVVAFLHLNPTPRQSFARDPSVGYARLLHRTCDERQA